MDNSKKKKKLSVWKNAFKCFAVLALVGHLSRQLETDRLSDDSSIDVAPHVLQSALVPGSTSDSAQMSRAPRAASADKLSTYVENLKSVARVTTGIYLSQHLIKGTDKQEAITSELLKMGSVTPAQIKGLNSTGLQAAITELKNLRTSPSTQAGFVQLIKNAEAGIIIQKNFVGITNITDWPEKSSFVNALDEIPTKGVDSSHHELKKNLQKFTVNYDDAKNDANEAAKVVNRTDAIINEFSKLNATARFSIGGRLIEDFYPIIRTVRSLQSRALIDDFNQQNGDLQATLNTFFGVGTGFSQLAGDLEIVNEVINTRYLPGSLRKLNHTTGMHEGREDLVKLVSDLNTKWMKDVINSTNFAKSIEVLKQLDNPLNQGNIKFGNSNQDQVSNFAKLLTESKKFVNISTKKTEFEAAVVSITSCKTLTTYQFTEAKVVVTKVEKLNDLLNEYRTSVQAAINHIQVKNLTARLTEFKSILQKSENQGKSFNAIFPSMDKWDLISSDLDSVHSFFNIDKIKQQCVAIKNLTDTVLPSLKNVVKNIPEMQCIANLQNLAPVEEFLELYKTVANQNNPTGPDYDNTIQSVASVASASVPLGTVLNAIGKIKGFTSDESKELKFLKNPKKVSDEIGNAVRGVGEIKKAIDAISKMNLVVSNQRNVTLERVKVQENLTTEEITQLVALENLNFTTMITELNNFKSAVEAKPLVKLTDAGPIFMAAKNVRGIQDNVADMLSALDRLKDLSTDSSKLDPMRDALSHLRKIELNFASFNQHYDPAKSMMTTMSDFFAKYHQADIVIQKSRSNNGAGGGYGPDVFYGASGVERGLKSVHWLVKYLYHIISTVGAIIVILTAVIVYAFWQKHKLKKEMVEMQVANKGVLEFFRLEGERQSKEDKKVPDRIVIPVIYMSVNPKDLTLEEIMKTLNSYNALPIADPPLNNIEAFIASQKKCLIVYGKRVGVEMTPRAKYAIYSKILKEYLEGAGDQDKAMEDLNYVNSHSEFIRVNSHLLMETRVKVLGYPDEFIHANYVRLSNGLILLAMQGPLGEVNEKPGKKDTCERTWQMFRQQYTVLIVMLCQVQEDGKKEMKCARYFPEKKGDKRSYGNVTVTCLSVEMVPPPAAKVADWEAQKKDGPCPSDIIIRILHAVYLDADGTRKARVYRHIQYVGWPDMKQPTYSESFQRLLRMVDKCTQPVVVHCSAGIGRTGVFCYVLLAAQRLAEEKCNLYGVLLNLRRKRTAMVHKSVQLAYCIHATVLYALKDKTLTEASQAELDELVDLYNRMEAGEVPTEIEDLKRDKGKKTPAAIEEGVKP